MSNNENNVKQWLKLFNAQETVVQIKAEQPNKQLCYVLDIEQKRPRVIVGHTKRNKNGQLAKPTNANIPQLLINKPDYLSMEDLAILVAVNTGMRSNLPIDLQDLVHGAQFLETLLSTQRCFYETVRNKPLSMGDELEVELGWAMDEYGNQILKSATKDLILFVLDKPMYIDVANSKVGNIKTIAERRTLINLLQAPPLAPNVIATVHKELSKVNKSLLPKIITDIKPQHLKPAMLLSAAGIYGIDFLGLKARHDDCLGYIHVYFVYDDIEVDAANPQLSFYRNKEGVLNEIHRNLAAEKELLAQLQWATGLLSFAKVHAKYHCYTHSHNMQLMQSYTIFNLLKPKFKNIEQDWHECIEKIRAEKWGIVIDESFPYQIAHKVDEWFANIKQDTNDWFSVELGIQVNGRKLDLLPLLTQMLTDRFIFEELENMGNGNIDITFPDGEIIALDAARLRMLLTFVKELFDWHGDGKPKLSMADAAALAEFSAATQALGLRWLGDSRLQKIGQRLKNFKGLQQVMAPKAFTATLRPYQQEGVNWLQFLREYNLGGILADDMGLGKTVQTLAHIAIEKEAGRLEGKPCIVIAPTSVIPNWSLEAKRFTPHLNVTILRAGMQRKNIIENLKAADIVLSTYALVLRDKDDLLKHRFHTIILDEAQFIKNSKAKVTQTINQLNADNHLCLTGTPLENHLGELWSLFNFLMPGFLGTEQMFNRVYRHPIEKQQDIAMRQSLMRRIQPFMVRRTKDKVATELPNKTEIIKMCELDSEQADLYETIRVSMHDKVAKEIANKGLARSHIVLLDALLKLRQVCCHPQLLKMDAAKNIKASVKLEQLMIMVSAMIEEGRKIVLFSQFSSMLALIEDAFNKENIRYVKIIGNTVDRLTPIETFQSGEVPVILISLKAGGTGINLTAADTVIHFDPWWNPAVEQQATDRVYRIGQDKPVFVYKMLAAETVEEKILLMQQKKAALAASIFNPDAKVGNALKIEDINCLFEPLGKVALSQAKPAVLELA